MAGDWIKMRVDLAADPDVIGIAAAVALDEDHVVGKLHRLWSWADQHTTDGNARSVTDAWIDRYVGVPGFAAALAAVGWLTITADGVAIPDFDAHNGESGKRRALTAKRASRRRLNSNAPSVTKSAQSGTDSNAPSVTKSAQSGTDSNAPSVTKSAQSGTDSNAPSVTKTSQSLESLNNLSTTDTPPLKEKFTKRVNFPMRLVRINRYRSHA